MHTPKFDTLMSSSWHLPHLTNTAARSDQNCPGIRHVMHGPKQAKLRSLFSDSDDLDTTVSTNPVILGPNYYTPSLTILSHSLSTETGEMSSALKQPPCGSFFY